MTFLSDDELHTETPWHTSESVGVLPTAGAIDERYYGCSQDGSGPRANGDRPLEQPPSRHNREQVTP